MELSVAAVIEHNGGGYFTELSSGKLLCSLNGHEVPARVDALQDFMRGHKYLRLKAAADAKKSLAKYDPFLVQSRNFDDKLYCSLTCQLLGKSVVAVRQHMRGKKFQRAKAKFEADETDLVDEPPLDPKAQQPEAMQEGSESEGAPAADTAGLEGVAATGTAGSAAATSSPTGEGPDLWIPGEYASMEAEATAEARAERRTSPEIETNPASASNRGKPSTGTAATNRSRPKPGKKQKLKRQRVS